MTDAVPKDVDERLRLRAEIAQLREANRLMQENVNDLEIRLKRAQTATISVDSIYKIETWINEKHRAAVGEVIAVLEKIASLPPRSTAGPPIARSALDTMRALYAPNNTDAERAIRSR